MGITNEEMMNKIIIKNYKNLKDKSPNTIDIDSKSGEVR